MNPSIPPLPAPQPREEAIQAAVLAATRAFHRREASRPLSQLEFLRQQNRFLHKRWWVLQAGVLGLLWWLLQILGSTAEVQRAMGTLAPLQQAADCLQSARWQSLLRQGLDRGLSFPAARQQAANALLGDTADCLRFPNNNLGVEYLRAIQNLKAPLTPHTIPRLGVGHDRAPEGVACHVSASYLREKLLGEDTEDLSPYLSPGEVSRLREDPASLSFCTQGVLARLRTMSEADFARLPDCGEGLSYRLFHAAGEAASLPALYEGVKSKRYPLSRIRRLVLWAFLGLQEGDRPPSLPYLRVLGFGPRGQLLLRQMKAQATLPVVVKPAHIRKLPPEAQQVFRLEARCTALYDLCRRDFGRTPGKKEYTQNPVRIS